MKLYSQYEHETQLIFELGRTLYRYTPPIIKVGRTTEFVASSILLKFNKSKFLVTAAHVIKRIDSRLLRIPFNKQVLCIGGSHIITNAGSIDEDRIDVAVFKLDDESVDVLAQNGFLFYDLGSIEIDLEDIHDENYITFGHPVNRNQVKAKHKKLRFEPFNFRTTLSDCDNLYSSLGLTKVVHQILQYRKRKIQDGLTGNIITGPTPYGMSGCGIWRIPHFLVAESSELKFFPTAMVTEYHVNRTALVGTRVNVISEIIRKTFAPDLQPSRKILINQNNLGVKPFPPSLPIPDSRFKLSV
ncbi:MAG TPA: hypothetical protein VK658_22600 [Chryseolinea sp.]|nr:hypothetical protein [Chryseolinea sp.]